MTDFWRQLEQIFEEEIRSADFAQADMDKILSVRMDRIENRSETPIALVNLAERGALQYQGETYQRLGRAVHTLLRDARLRAAKVDQS